MTATDDCTIKFHFHGLVMRSYLAGDVSGGGLEMASRWGWSCVLHGVLTCMASSPPSRPLRHGVPAVGSRAGFPSSAMALECVRKRRRDRKQIKSQQQGKREDDKSIHGRMRDPVLHLVPAARSGSDARTGFGASSPLARSAEQGAARPQWKRRRKLLLLLLRSLQVKSSGAWGGGRWWGRGWDDGEGGLGRGEGDLGQGEGGDATWVGEREREGSVLHDARVWLASVRLGDVGSVWCGRLRSA